MLALLMSSFFRPEGYYENDYYITFPERRMFSTNDRSGYLCTMSNKAK